MRLSFACVLAAGLVTTINSAAIAQEEKTDIYSLILALSDLEDATRLMTVYDANEDGVVDKSEQERLSWKDEVSDFDMNKDGKLTHLEIVVRQAKLRDDKGITQFDIKNVSTFLRRYDKNRNKQLEPDEIESGGWPPDPSEYDRNSDGILTASEMAAQFAFNRSLRREMGIEAVDNVGANHLLAHFDKDNDKKLAADEHAKAPLPKLAKDFDEDEDGKLGLIELATMLAKHRRDAGLSKPDTVKIRNLFRQFDSDADGRIELKGLAGLSVVAGVSVEKQLGETYDGNQDGVVTIAEVEKVVAAVRKERGYVEEEFQKAKQMITRHDRNNSKHIEESELFEKPEIGYLPKSMFKDADLNEDGKVGLDELARYFAKQKS